MDIAKDISRKYLPYTIYQNLQKFLIYRKLELVSGSIYSESKKAKSAIKTDVFMDQDEFIKSIQYYGYILIETRDAPTKDRRFNKNVSVINRKKLVKTFILLLDINSIYSQTSQNFSKILNRIPEFDTLEKKHNMDIIVI